MNEISVLSFNIWFDEYMENERFYALLACIYGKDPDIICFQEVKPLVYKKLIKNLKKYKYYFPNNISYSYGCAILSKYPITKSLQQPYKSTNMGRELLIAKIDYPVHIKEEDSILVDRTEIIFATTHFESEFKRIEKNKNKMDQIKEAKATLESLYDKYKNIIFCVDSNLIDGEENEFIPTGKDSMWNDAWKLKGNNENKFTFDSYRNIYLQAKRCKYRSRLDRILFCAENCQLKDFDIIKNASDGVLSWIPPSDHFGIYGKFEIKI